MLRLLQSVKPLAMNQVTSHAADDIIIIASSDLIRCCGPSKWDLSLQLRPLDKVYHSITADQKPFPSPAANLVLEARGKR